MTHQISSEAAARRDAHRKHGKFGLQPASESGQVAPQSHVCARCGSTFTAATQSPDETCCTVCVVQGLTESVSRAKTLRSLLAQYDQHGNYRRYVTDLVAALGYTQKNGFATKTLVAPNGNEFDIPPEIARNRDEPAQTMHLLAMRLRSGSRHRSTREFEDFLGNDGSWFMVERRL